MSSLQRILALEGNWRGSYRLIVNPADPARASESRASVAPVALRRFARIDYTWDFDGRPQNARTPRRTGSSG